MIMFLKFWAIIIAMWGLLKMLICRPSTWKKEGDIEIVGGQIVKYEPIGAFFGGLIYFALGVTFVIFV